MSHKSFRRAWLFRSVLLFGFFTFIPLNVLNISECFALFPNIRLIQDPLILLRNLFPILLTGLAAWLTRSTGMGAKPLKFVLHYVAVPLFVTYGILGVYLSNTLCYSNVISNQLVSLYVDGWLSEITNSLLLGLFLGTIYGLSAPVLRRVLISGYSWLEWVISGERPQVYKISVHSYHNNSLFLTRACLLGLLMPLVLSFTTPIYQEVTQSPPHITLYFFNSALQVSLLTVPFLVALGESLTLAFDRTRRLSDGYFRWLLAALSLGALANFVLLQLSKLTFDLHGVAYLAKPMVSVVLMFVGASVATTFSLEIGEQYITRRRIFAWICVAGVFLSVLFLVETSFGFLLLNSSFLGKRPNPLLVSWNEMIFVSEPLPIMSTYLAASILIYVLSFVVMVLFYYRASLPGLKISRIVSSVLLGAIIFVYQWSSPSGYATTWRSLLCAALTGLLAYCYLPIRSTQRPQEAVPAFAKN